MSSRITGNPVGRYRAARSGPSKPRPTTPPIAYSLTCSWVDAADRGRVSDTLHRDEIRAQTERDMLRVRVVTHLGERLLEDAFELVVDLALLPKERLQVLHPLEVRDGDAARVG